MRLWSLHPRYLDSKGLVAVWREGLLALSVLKGKTHGYKNHPQLRRFKTARNPVGTLKCYLWHIYLEARNRNYRFDFRKLGKAGKCQSLRVTRGQLMYEMNHLKKKLKLRDPERLKSLNQMETLDTHPLFTMVEGNVEEWEKTDA